MIALDHDTLWAKACFEYTDFDTHAVVTVITNKKSDDADEIWLQLSRKEDIFAIHYSLDGVEFTMARLAPLPMSEKIKVGFEANTQLAKVGSKFLRMSPSN